MVSKFVVVLASLVAAAHSSGVPLTRAVSEVNNFGYDVASPGTGDFKHQSEVRVGDSVRGQYSLLQPDGLRRIVDYGASERGFDAVVRYEPIAIPAPLLAAPAPAIVTQEPFITRSLGRIPYPAIVNPVIATPPAPFRTVIRPSF